MRPPGDVHEPRDAAGAGPGAATGSDAYLRKRADRNDSPCKRGAAPATPQRAPSVAALERLGELGVSSEPIQAFLRIRPPPASDGTATAPYVRALSDTEVVMVPPPPQGGGESDPGMLRGGTSARMRAANAPTKYVFSKVFSYEGGACDSSADTPAHASAHAHVPPGAYPAGARSHAPQTGAPSQTAFFTHTTLPLVQDVLDGRNALVFTYGVTNSGKTYTVQGGATSGEAGILPRALDVIFSSIAGQECTSAIRPVGLTGVQPGISEPCSSLLSGAQAHTSRQRGAVLPLSDTRVLPVDRAFRYSVWVSYVEVYNEKLYDLLETATPSLLHRHGDGAARAAEPHDAHLKRAARRPLLLKSEAESGGKYVGGLREIRVASGREAKELLLRGQENRTVFGTMANRASSRSHSVFTVKILRERRDASMGDMRLSHKYAVSRLSIVDLAGSERIANTDLSSGPRLKEAGSINKSLMCLGQCLDTMRRNQIRAGIADAHGGAADERGTAATADARRRRQSIIPFRHSKLTELFQSFFTGDGKVVMIVNVNPFGTGYDENANVMRFSAMAKEVGINVNAAERRDAPLVDASPDASTASVHTALDAGVDDAYSDASDDGGDRFVDMLVEENERLHARCERAEALCRNIETTVRDEMSRYMEDALRKMQRYYEEQLRAEMDENDIFVDRKIDLFARMAQESVVPARVARASAHSDGTALRQSPALAQPLDTCPTTPPPAKPAAGPLSSSPRDAAAPMPLSQRTDANIPLPVCAPWDKSGREDELLLDGASPAKRRLRKKAAVQSEEIAAHVAMHVPSPADTPRRGVRRSLR
ncbi:succinate--hydroxymethylglutarate CoA-transferase [Malassezia sp. CBS 17886]|nr:succinate--hydroxymethylglutarate CoA-transferase [Malassezia sp. CBS 17886]